MFKDGILLGFGKLITCGWSLGMRLCMMAYEAGFLMGTNHLSDKEYTHQCS